MKKLNKKSVVAATTKTSQPNVNPNQVDSTAHEAVLQELRQGLRAKLDRYLCTKVESSDRYKVEITCNGVVLRRKGYESIQSCINHFNGASKDVRKMVEHLKRALAMKVTVESERVALLSTHKCTIRMYDRNECIGNKEVDCKLLDANK